jgi:protein ImuB
VRVVAVGHPDWSATVAAVRHGPPGAVPLAVVRANRVVATTPAARAAGVVVGQRRREAQRTCPGLVLAAPDPAADARAFDPVVRALGDVAARVEVVRPGWCTFAARAASRYHGGDEALAARVRSVVATAAGAAGGGAAPAVAVADGRFSALVLAARAPGDVVVVAPGGSAAALAPLPVASYLDVLEPDDPDRSAWTELIGLLGRLGLRRLGDVAALPAGDLVARFGVRGGLAHAWAAGTDEEPPATAPPPDDLTAVLELDPPPPDVEPVAFAVRGTAEALCERLAADGTVAVEVLVHAETEHGERDERRWRRELGFTAAALVERVRWQLEGWAARPDGPTAGITSVRLVPTAVVVDRGHQEGFWGGRSGADERAARTVARLIGVLGPDAVLVPEWRGGRDPGDAVVLVPAAAVDLAERAAAVAPPSGAGPWPGALPAPSPAWVAPAPVPAEVLDADGRPVTVSGRGALGAVPATCAWPGRSPLAVVDHAGPWPADERWWDPPRRRRRARVQLALADGTGVLVAREHEQWWLLAIHD